MKTGVVIPVAPGRDENLRRVLRSIADGLVVPESVVLVLDGFPVGEIMGVVSEFHDADFVLGIVEIPKHQPGMTQPRNSGVRWLVDTGREFTHVWFLDSDCIVEPYTLMAFEWALQKGVDRILAGRYDWLGEGSDDATEGLEMIDPRAPSFERHTALETFRGDLSAGLACFSGNLVWPIAKFQSVGGFWSEIHHGRCEDGELGLRAVQMGIPISYVGIAQAWHLWHPRNLAWAQQANERDVPMLNERHPWVEQRCKCGHNEMLHGVVDGKRLGACRDCACEEFEQALFVVEHDGRRFDARCPEPGCDWSGNTGQIWEHEATHSLRR